jgi:hypothetical protein
MLDTISEATTLCDAPVPYGEWCNNAPCTRKRGHKGEHVAIFTSFDGDRQHYARCAQDLWDSDGNRQAVVSCD